MEALCLLSLIDIHADLVDTLCGAKGLRLLDVIARSW